MKQLRETYSKIKPQIASRIYEFDKIRHSNKSEFFLRELVFCLLTPQSKAKTCDRVLNEIFKNGFIFTSSQEELAHAINNVRFKNNKSKYIKEALQKLESINLKEKIESFSDIYKARDWLVGNFKGLGYKEASHFLRNTGFGYELAILDRHILKNLVLFNIIDEIPKSLNEKKYKEIEKKMQGFSKKIDIPMHHLDFLLWYKQTKEVFK